MAFGPSRNYLCRDVARNDLPTGTVTFLFTDVEGSTRLLHELGSEAYAEAQAYMPDIKPSRDKSDGGALPAASSPSNPSLAEPPGFLNSQPKRFARDRG